MAEKKVTSIKIEFRGEEIEIPKADEAWFKEKIKADQEAAKEAKKAK